MQISSYKVDRYDFDLITFDSHSVRKARRGVQFDLAESLRRSLFCFLLDNPLLLLAAEDVYTSLQLVNTVLAGIEKCLNTKYVRTVIDMKMLLFINIKSIKPLA